MLFISFSLIILFICLIFRRLVQTIFLLPRYLQRNHDMIAKSLERHSITDEDLKAFEEDEQQNNNENQTENQSESIEELKKLN